MRSNSEPVQLSPAQVAELNERLHELRHNVNNSLAAIVSAMELLRFKPETTERMTATAIGRTRALSEEMRTFSREFERILGAGTSESEIDPSS